MTFVKYINFKGYHGVETVDEINSNDFKSLKEYRAEANRLLNEYRLSGMNVYLSTRCSKCWK